MGGLLGALTALTASSVEQAGTYVCVSDALFVVTLNLRDMYNYVYVTHRVTRTI